MFKRSGKRFLSVLLAVVVVFASVPMAFAEYVNYEERTVTGTDGKTYRYFSDGAQFVRKGNSGNAFMNIWVDNHYRFMLTEETQKFYFVQNLRLQHQYELFQSKSTYFDKLELYTGQALTGTPDAQPTEAQKDATNELIQNNNLQETFWTAANSNAQEKVDDLGASYVEGTIPSQYEFHANALSAGGNKNYYWDGLSSFETSDAFQKTFYNVLSWYKGVDDKNAGVPTNYVVFGITLDVTDVRELISKVDEYKGIIANPEGYSPEQIEQYQKYIDSIPEGMLEGTTYYTQEQVDTVYDYVTGVIDDFADTEEYMYYREKALELIKKDADGNYIHTDVYTSSSLSAFETAFKAVDIGVYFPYPVSRQSEVDEATIKVKATFSELAGVNTETHSSSGTTTDTVWETTDGIDVPSGDTDNDHTIFKFSNTSYKFVQVTDNQEFSFNQELTGRAKNVSYNLLGAVRPNFESFTFDATCDGTNCVLDEESDVINNTLSFIERLDATSKTTTDGVTSFNGWKYNSRLGDTVHGFNITNGVLQQTLLTSDTQFMGSTTYHDFYGDATITFKGNGNEVDENGKRISRESEIDASFYWKLTSSYDGTYYHAHIPVEILITDVRPLSDLYDELYKFANFSASVDEREIYTNESVESVRTALASVPVDMVYGTKYYTQAEVNSYYDALTNAKENLETKEKSDYTRLDSAIIDAETLLNNGTVYTESSKKALEEALEAAKSIDRNLSKNHQSVIDSAADVLEEKTSALNKKADYSDYNNLKSELDQIISNGNNGDFTDEEWQSFVDSVVSTDENLDKDLPESEQSKIDNALQELENAKEVYEGRQKADYSELENALLKAESILNDTEKVYTDGSKNELQSIYDKATALDKNLPASEQSKIEEVLSELNGAIDGIKEKADYSALDEAIEKAKEALNRTDIKYTANAEQILRDALTGAGDVTRDLSTDDQYIIDGAVDSLENATENLIEAADTTAYEDAVKDAEEIISEGNSQGRYDEEDWNKFIESVTNTKDTVGSDIGNIPKTEQDKVDTATDTINNATEEIYNKRYIFVSFKGESGEVYRICKVHSDGRTFGDLTDMPELPESNGFKKYIGWYYKNNTIMNLTDAITEDVTVFCYEEEIKLVAKAESGATIDETNDFFKGLKHGTTVDALLNSLDNNTAFIVVKDINGNIVDNSQLIATGMTIELVSRENNLVVNEKVTVVVRGDITGDGLVNDEDFEKSRGMCLKTTEYGENEKAFFAANDTDGDGVLDVIDLFNISNMRYGN